MRTIYDALKLNIKSSTLPFSFSHSFTLQASKADANFFGIHKNVLLN